MELEFHKYQGTGNDFILIDNRNGKVSLTVEQITFLCDRRFGIGADGLMLLKSHPDFDFEMDYYNSDGSGGTMCGNGGRCIVAFAKSLGIFEKETRFIASDGEHLASVDEEGLVNLKMIDVDIIKNKGDDMYLYTGSPHYIQLVNDVENVDVVKSGREIRYNDEYKAEGTNVNFVSALNNGIAVRTYERGVENETLACGTGSVASAMAFYLKMNLNSTVIPVKVQGGELEISFKQEKKEKFTNVYLKGPATYVYKGVIKI